MAPVAILKGYGRLKRTSARQPVEMLAADLSSMAQALDHARKAQALTGRLDLLVNNAGGLEMLPDMTNEGLEVNMVGGKMIG